MVVKLLLCSSCSRELTDVDAECVAVHMFSNGASASLLSLPGNQFDISLGVQMLTRCSLQC